MATYPLSNTADEVDNAIQSVVASSTNTITAGGSGLVTSGVIKNYVDTELANRGTIVTSSDTFPDSDSHIPTCAAVRDATLSVISETEAYNLKGEDSRSSTGQFDLISDTSLDSFFNIDTMPRPNGVTSAATVNNSFRVNIAANTYFSIRVYANIRYGSSDGSPAQTFAIRDGSNTLAAKTNAVSGAIVDDEVYWRQTRVRYATSAKQYDFNAYWTEGDAASCNLLRFQVLVTTYLPTTLLSV